MIGPHLHLFKSLNDHGVEYLLIGGVAVVAHGAARTTKDIDFFIRPTVENATKCLAALEDVGFGTVFLTTPEKLCATEVTIFKDIVRVDILTRVKGIDFVDAYHKKIFFKVGDILIPTLNKQDLIRTKKAAGRDIDLEDVIVLESKHS